MGADAKFLDKFYPELPKSEAEEESNDKPMTPFDDREIKHELHDFAGEVHRDVCYVPTARFSARAKYDMEILIKFSLLDVRFLRPVGRGRPRMAIKISDLGTRFLKDLVERQLV